MKIQPVNASFTGTKRTEKGNEYQTSNIGKKVGLVSGVALGAGLVGAQLCSLKTVAGKRNLVESFIAEGKSLNDVMKKTVKRTLGGTIIPPENGVTERTKKIVKDFTKTISLYGAAIAGLSTAVGAVVDKNITIANAKEADDKAFFAKLYR